MTKIVWRSLAAGTLLAVVACASSQSGDSSRTESGRADRTLLTADELSQGAPANLFDAIRVLRPEWLSARGSSGFGQVAGLVIYQDNAMLGGEGTLRGIQTVRVGSARYINATEAQARFGSGHSQGAILITTKR